MRIGVGLDLDLDGYAWLLERASAFASRAGASLDLVYVGAGPTRQATLDQLRDTLPEAIRGQARLLAGDPVEVLVDMTDDYDAVVIGPREPTGIERLYQNAIAVKILRRARCPVYVPRTERFGDHAPRILLGVDLRSDRLAWVMNEAARWTTALDATLDVVHAIPRSMPAVRRADLKAAVEREWEATHAETLQATRALLDALPEAHRGSASIAPGEAEDVLIDGAASHDLLLVGNRDRRGIERFLLGGVARVVVVRAACDVLVLPTQSQG